MLYFGTVNPQVPGSSPGRGATYFVAFSDTPASPAFITWQRNNVAVLGWLDSGSRKSWNRISF